MTLLTYYVIEKAGTSEGAKKGWLKRKRAIPKPRVSRLYFEEEIPMLEEKARGKYYSSKYGDLILDHVALEMLPRGRKGFPLYYLKQPGAITPAYIIALEPKMQKKLKKFYFKPADIQRWINAADKQKKVEKEEIPSEIAEELLKEEEISDRVQDFHDIFYQERLAGSEVSLQQRISQYLNQLRKEGKDPDFIKKVLEKLKLSYDLF